jgi:signal transduction histidine kinase
VTKAGRLSEDEVMPRRMRARVSWSGGRPVALAALPVALAALVLIEGLGVPGALSPGLLASTTAIGVVGALLAGLRPRYVGGWLLFACGTAFLVGQWCETRLAVDPPGAGEVPVTAWIASWIYQPALVLLFVLVPLTFPDGRVPTPRWRPVAALGVLVAGALVLVGAFAVPTLRVGPATSYPNPYAVIALKGSEQVGDVLALATLALSAAAVVSLVLRYRAAPDDVRSQILWVTVACVVLGAAFALDATVALLVPSAYPAVFPVIQLAPVVLPVAVAVAVLRHRLFDIKVLVGRVLVYGVLTAGLLGVYAATAVGVTRVVPASPDLGRLLAAAVVALAFAPLRSRLQDVVARRLFGDRAQPYAALVRVSQEVAGPSTTPDRMLTSLAASTAAALRSPWVAVELTTGDGVRATGEAGRRADAGSEHDVAVRELTHAGDSVGRLLVAARAHDAFTVADHRLLTDLAVPIGTALHALRLSLQLRASRERLVTSVEDERRRTGRDLHDSLGPRLAAIGMTVETAAELVETDPQAARRLLSVLLQQTDAAVSEVRQLAHTQRPPVLDALGLVGALETHLVLLSPLRARLEVRGEWPETLPAAVEIAAYRIVLEAVTNVTRHAHAGLCQVALTAGEDLQVEVTDDGDGLVPDDGQGVGLPSMRERAEELGGEFHVRPGSQGRGTVVTARLPLTATAPTVPPPRRPGA